MDVGRGNEAGGSGVFLAFGCERLSFVWCVYIKGFFRVLRHGSLKTNMLCTFTSFGFSKFLDPGRCQASFLVKSASHTFLSKLSTRDLSPMVVLLKILNYTPSPFRG